MSSRCARELFNIGAICNAVVLPDQPAKPLGMNTANEQMMNAQYEFLISTKAPFPSDDELPGTVARASDALLKLQIFVGVPGEAESAFRFILRSVVLRQDVGGRRGPKRSANPAPSDRRHDLRNDVEAMVQGPFGREGDLQVVLLSRAADERIKEVQVDIKIHQVFTRDEPD